MIRQFLTLDIALHAAAAVPLTLLLWALGMPTGNAVLANALLWLLREQDQVWGDEDEGPARFRRVPIAGWSANKNAEWAVPAVVGALVGIAL